ncbi:hypothetical protein MMC27_001277 [Xylographa pallens]|nr:hypothetical protein [Xylographa pallens]
MRSRNIRRRLENFLRNLHRRNNPRPSASPHIVTTIRPGQITSDVPHHTNDLPTPRTPSADPPHNPLATEIPVRAYTRTCFLFLAQPSEERAPTDYHTRASDDIEQRVPSSLEDLAQAPIVNNEVRIAELMVDWEDFGLVISRIESIWDDFDAADAGNALLYTSGFIYCCQQVHKGLIPWGLVTQEAEMSQRMRERPIGAGARLREARLRREEERARAPEADDTLTEGSL